MTARTDLEAESLWRPLLELGFPAHRWIEQFLEDWWLRDWPANIDLETFHRRCGAMVDFVWTDDRWNRQRRSSTDVECALFGLTDLVIGSGVWSERRASIVRDGSSLFNVWVQRNLRDPSGARAFLSFLSRPAAVGLHVVAIGWIDKLIAERGFWPDSYRDLEHGLVAFLEHVYEGGIWRKENDTRQAFLRLLRILMERQNDRARTLLECTLSA